MDDPSLLGSHELILIAIANDSVGTNLPFNGQNKITIDAIGACAFTEVVPVDFEDIQVWAGQVVPVNKQFKFTDKLSDE